MPKPKPKEQETSKNTQYRSRAIDSVERNGPGYFKIQSHKIHRPNMVNARMEKLYPSLLLEGNPKPWRQHWPPPTFLKRDRI